MDIRSAKEIFGINDKPQIPYTQFEEALYRYETNPKAKEALQYLVNTRGFKLSTIQYFHVGYNEENHEITIPVIKDSELIDYKYRGITDKTFRRHPGSATWVVNELALQYASEDGYLICVEGEYDAMAVYQMGHRSVVSTTGGAQGQTPWVNRIPEGVKVYINYDNDEPGQEAAQKLAERVGIERCYNVILPTKDANDFLLDGHTEEDYDKVLRESPRFKIKDVYKIADIIDSLEQNKLKRVDTFSERLTAHLDGGIPKKSLVTISGKSGVGKSTALMNMLVHHADQGKPVLLVSLENDLYFTVQRLLEVKYKKPHTQLTKEEWSMVRTDMIDYPFYIDVSMETYTMDKIEKILEQAKKLYGIEFFGFDHIGFLPTRDDPREISQMVRNFKLLARKNDIIIYMISHVRRSLNANDYLTSDELKGSSSIAQDSDMVLLVVDTKAGLEISIDKARMSRSKLRIPMNFDGPSGVISDDLNRQVKHYDDVIDDPTIEKTDTYTVPVDENSSATTGEIDY